MTNGRSRTIWAAAGAVGGALVFVVLLVVLANANTAQRVSANAETLHRTNATLGSAALVRAAAGQVALVEDLVENGSASVDVLDAAESELQIVLEAFSGLVSEGDTDIQRLGLALESATVARPLDMTAVDDAFEPLKAELSDAIARSESTIATSEDSAQRLYVLLRVAVTLIIPVAVVLFYRRRAAAQVRSARTEMKLAIESERTISRAKSEFVAGLSHEMRTPLTGIYGFTELLLDTVDDESVLEMVQAIHKESSELARMVDDFIAMSRLDSDSMAIVTEPVDIVGIARSTADQYRTSATGPGQSIDVTGDAPPALADSGKVRQVLTNLVANAVQHGGHTVRISLSDGPNSVVCEVVDDGGGVPPDMEHRLFNRYIHDGAEVLTRGSQGLGTWIAAVLAERMGGSLEYARRDRQTVFTLTLPSTQSESVPDQVDHDSLVTA